MSQSNESSSARQMMLYDANKKSPVVAYLLWFFLGWLGGHRFYMGKTGSAIALLVLTLLSWLTMVLIIGFFGLAVVGIWLIVDAFLIPAWVAAANNKLIAGMT